MDQGVQLARWSGFYTEVTDLSVARSESIRFQ